MATPARLLTNDYRDCKLVKLDDADPKSPLVVMQEGYASSDVTCRMRMFYLQRDGFWIDEIARSTLPDSEAGDIVFETPGEALELLSQLHGRAMIRELPVTPADVQAYAARAQSGASAQLFRGFLARYRAAQAKA
jgi:hypothetical protein